jgi:hypothetical protein
VCIDKAKTVGAILQDGEAGRSLRKRTNEIFSTATLDCYVRQLLVRKREEGRWVACLKNVIYLPTDATGQVFDHQTIFGPLWWAKTKDGAN